MLKKYFLGETLTHFSGFLELNGIKSEIHVVNAIYFWEDVLFYLTAIKSHLGRLKV